MQLYTFVCGPRQNATFLLMQTGLNWTVKCLLRCELWQRKPCSDTHGTRSKLASLFLFIPPTLKVHRGRQAGLFKKKKCFKSAIFCCSLLSSCLTGVSLTHILYLYLVLIKCSLIADGGLHYFLLSCIHLSSKHFHLLTIQPISC